MPLETATFISDLVSANPTAPDGVNQGDDHIRLIKSAIKATFPNLNGAVTLTPTQLNAVAASVNIAPTDPTGTSSPTLHVMMGLGVAGFTITPTKSGRVLVVVSGWVGSTGGGWSYRLQQGTGAAPANGAALAGTSISNSPLFAPGLSTSMPFSIQGYFTGVVGTPYWLDFGLRVFGGAGTASVGGLTCTAAEM